MIAVDVGLDMLHLIRDPGDLWVVNHKATVREYLIVVLNLRPVRLPLLLPLSLITGIITSCTCCVDVWVFWFCIWTWLKLELANNSLLLMESWLKPNRGQSRPKLFHKTTIWMMRLLFALPLTCIFTQASPPLSQNKQIQMPAQDFEPHWLWFFFCPNIHFALL